MIYPLYVDINMQIKFVDNARKYEIIRILAELAPAWMRSSEIKSRGIQRCGYSAEDSKIHLLFTLSLLLISSNASIQARLIVICIPQKKQPQDLGSV